MIMTLPPHLPPTRGFHRGLGTPSPTLGLLLPTQVSGAAQVTARVLRDPGYS